MLLISLHHHPYSFVIYVIILAKEELFVRLVFNKKKKYILGNISEYLSTFGMIIGEQLLVNLTQ